MWIKLKCDKVRKACEKAVFDFGSNRIDGKFNAAAFSVAFREITGMSEGLDGEYVRAILSGRDDVEELSGGSHFRLVRFTILDWFYMILGSVFMLIGVLTTVFLMLCALQIRLYG